MNDKNYEKYREAAENKVNKELLDKLLVENRDFEKAIQELAIHQTELEMQNEELKEAQNKLEESRNKYFTLYDFTPVSYLIIDYKGIIIEANNTTSKVLCIDKAYLSNKPFMTYIESEYQELFYNHRKKVLETKKPQEVVLKIKKRDGSNFYARLCSIFYTQKNNKDLFLTVLLDIDSLIKKQKIEKELEYQIQYQKLISEISSDFLNVNEKNIDDKINEFLRKAGIFFRMDRSYLGKFSSDSKEYSITYEWCDDNIEPDIQNHQNIPLNKLSWWKSQIFNNKYSFIANVEELPIEASFEKEIFMNANIKSLLFIPVIINERITGFLGFDSVNEIKNWKEFHIDFLLIAADTISKALTKIQIDGELMKAKEEADKLNKSKSVFLSKITHDLKSPLNGISGFVKLIKDQTESEEILNYIHYIDYSVEKMINLIDNLLDISKIESNKLILNKNKFNIKKEISELINTYIYSGNSNNNSIEFYIDEKIPEELIGDKYRLNRIIQNILSNSIKFTNKGNISLKVLLDDEKEDSCKLIFIVTDTGVGIEDEKLNHMFNLYYQAHDYHGKGSGLGLSLSKELVELMYGKMNIESKPNKGTKVTFTAIFDKII